MVPRLPISRPRPASATISCVGSTLFCSGTRPSSTVVRTVLEECVPMSEPQVVVGVALIRDGLVLAALRPGPGGGWEFPGGKVEPGETDAQAAIRELREELSVE